MRQLHPMQEILKLRLWTKRVERRLKVLIHEGTATFSEDFVHPYESRILLSEAQVYPCDVKRGYLAYRRSRYEQLVKKVPSWLLHASQAISMSQSCRPERKDARAPARRLTLRNCEMASVKSSFCTYTIARLKWASTKFGSMASALR